MQIKIGNYIFHTADSWNELPQKLVYPAYFILKADNLTPVVRLSELTKLLLNIGDEFIDTWRGKVIEKHGVTDGEAIWSEDWSKIVAAVTAPFTESIEHTTRLTYQISLTLTNCPVSVIRLQKVNGITPQGIRTLIASEDGFKNITIGEFARIDTLFQRYMETGDEQHIFECLAVIYRPEKEYSKAEKKANWHGDRRLPLSVAQFSVKERAKMMTQIKPEWRQLLWFWVASCREQILRQWKSVLNPSVSTKKGYWDEKLTKFGWSGLFIELAASSGQTEAAISELLYSDVFVKLAYLETKRKAELTVSPL
jgi:hypothetical protein